MIPADTNAVWIQRMRAGDAIAIRRQASQQVQLGLTREISIEEAEDLAEGPGEAWTAWRGTEPVACMGLRETFPGAQAVAWAILADGVGAAHLAITRWARARIRASRLPRIEAIVRRDSPAECTWAKLVGMEPLCVLRRFGAASEDHVLYERIR